MKLNWFDKLIIKLFKWNFYKKVDLKNPKTYYISVLRDLTDDYHKFYMTYIKNEIYKKGKK